MRAALMVETRPVAAGWWHRAACNGRNTDDFYPSTGEDPEPAKAVCEDCPVRRDCLEDALTRETCDTSTHGVWGGRSAKQRRQIRRCRARACGHASPSECLLE